MVESEQAELKDQVAQAEQQEPEKMLSQSEVNKLVGKLKSDERQKAYDKARREIMAELENQQVSPPQNQQAQPMGNMGGMPQLNADQVRQMIAEETSKQNQVMREQYQQQQLQDHMNKIASSFIQKMESGKAKHPDFEAKIAELNLPSLPEIVELAEGVDNTADVMMDLANNPHKIGNMLMTFSRNKNLARKSMADLSASIKNNEAAKNIKMPGDPLQKIQSSANANSNLGDGLDVSVADLQKFFSKGR